MTMRQIGECLDSETIARIEELKGRTGMEGDTRPAVAQRQREENPLGNVVRMPLRKGSTKPHTGSPSGVVLPFRKSIDRHYASAPR